MVTKCLCLYLHTKHRTLSWPHCRDDVEPSGAEGAVPVLQKNPLSTPHVPTYPRLFPPALRDQRGLFTPRKPCYSLGHSPSPRAGEHIWVVVSPICFQIGNGSAVCSSVWEREVMFRREPLRRVHQGSPHRMLLWHISKFNYATGSNELEIWKSMSWTFQLPRSQGFITSSQDLFLLQISLQWQADHTGGQAGQRWSQHFGVGATRLRDPCVWHYLLSACLFF